MIFFFPGVRWLHVRSQHNHLSASGISVSTPCWAVSTRGITAFPSLSSCKWIGGLLIQGWKPILPGVRWHFVRFPVSQRPASGAGVSTPCGAVSTRGITVFVPTLSELQMYGGISDPGCRPRAALALFSSPSQSAIGRWGWGFHTVRGGADPGDQYFRPQVVGVIDV